MISGVNGDGRGSDVVKALGLVFGLLAGLVTLVYAVGGGVLALRLFFEDLPSLTVVGQLPREYLIAVGLTQIVLPVLVAAGLYLGVRLLVGSSVPPPARLVQEWTGRSWRGWGEFVGVSALLALVVVFLGASPAYTREGLSRKLLWLLLVGFVVTWLVMMVALKLRAALATRERDTWNTSRVAVWMTSIVALASLPAFVIFAGTFHFLDAKVCAAGPRQISGVFIGESSDRVYIGESNHRTAGPRRVVSIPLSQVEEVLIGGEAATERCRD